MTRADEWWDEPMTPARWRAAAELWRLEALARELERAPRWSPESLRRSAIQCLRAALVGDAEMLAERERRSNA